MQEKHSLPERTRKIAIDHHHDVAGEFERFYTSTDRFSNAFHYGRHKVDVLLDAELKALDPDASILDVGCGTGEYLRRLRQLGFSPTGVEPAPAMRERALRDNPDTVVVDGVATALPFADASFELVMAIEVLRYLHRSDVVIAEREIMRVLRPGGKAFVTFVNRFALDGFYALQRARQLRRRTDFDRRHPHCEFTTPAEVIRDFESAGAEGVQVEGRLFAPLRLLYKASDSLAAKVARVVEPYDDHLCQQAWSAPFAGHLVAVATKPL